MWYLGDDLMVVVDSIIMVENRVMVYKLCIDESQVSKMTGPGYDIQ